jgi:1-acyl-sn-glycerol-3-phosphate acyltransferase
MTATVAAKRHVGPYYKSSIVIYRILRCLIGGIMHLLYRYRAEGAENVPAHGPVILLVNHLHLFDPGVVSTAVRRKIVTLAAGKWRDHVVIHSFLKAAGVIFVKRGEVDRQALKACLDVLEGGGVLAIAPEGTRSRTGGLQRGKPGVAYIAQRADTVIVPVAHWGVERVREWRLFQRPECHIVIGKPFRLPQGSGRVTTEYLQELADFAMVQIGQHLPESYRGVYAEQIAAHLAGQAAATCRQTT